MTDRTEDATDLNDLDQIKLKLDLLDQRLQITFELIQSVHDDAMTQAKIRHDHIGKLIDLLFEAKVNKD